MYSNALVNKANVLFGLQEVGQCQDCFTQALVVDPACADVYIHQARVCKGMQWYARVYKGMQGYTRVCKGMQWYTRVCSRLHVYYAHLCIDFKPANVYHFVKLILLLERCFFFVLHTVAWRCAVGSDCSKAILCVNFLN